LPTDHKYKKNKKDFYVSRVEKDVASPLPSDEELYDVVSEYDNIVFGFQSGKKKFSSFYLTHNWIKQSIFWEFSCWKTNLLFHNFDVMHIEKTIFENIFNTIMNVKGKIDDSIKVRIDIFLFCHRKNIKLVYDRLWAAKPKASFALDKNTQLLVY
jgi:hypothetical protein